MSLILLVAGLAILTVAADILVRGSVGLAERFGIPQLVIGLTIVAFGTSAPELVVSLQAALAGSGGIALGNIVGSNITNVLLVLGVPAMVRTVSCQADGAKRNLFLMIVITAVFIGLMWDGVLSASDGFLLLGFLIVFFALQVVLTRDHDPEEDVEPARSLPLALAYSIGGIIGLAFGAELTVRAATDLARSFGVSETVIGMTLVAFGTSLPELITTTVAALRNHSAVAFGNVIGSNVFNIAAILGLTAAIVPIDVPADLLTLDVWLMVASTLLLVPFVTLCWPMGRAVGGAMTLAYVAAVVAIWTT